MVDSYMWGKVDRISPEAPIPIISINNKDNRLGGAANVGLNLKALGAEPIICAVVGKDSMGDEFKSLIKKDGITDKGIISSEHRPTTVKTRIISQGQQLIRVDEEVTRKLHEEIEHEFIEQVKTIIIDDNPEAIIFQDYDKGVITPVLIEEVVCIARDHDIPVLVDPKKKNFKHYKNVQLFKPNFKELVEGMKIEANKEDVVSIFKAVKKLHDKNHINLVMVTLSEAGIFISDGEHFNTLPAEIRDISDVSGAGDTVISVACLCLIANIDPLDVAAISNIAGGLVCEKVGVVPIDKHQLLDECLEAYS